MSIYNCQHKEFIQHTGYRGANSNYECTECGLQMTPAELLIYTEIKQLQKAIEVRERGARNEMSTL